MKIKTVFGKGTNDADYQLNLVVNGKKVLCPYYAKWYEMIRRCFSERYQRQQPSYKVCSVCDEWLTFSNFKAWMETQHWEGKQLDKDLLVEGNKIYSPETCCFIPQLLNSFIKDTYHDNTNSYRGVTFYKKLGKYHAQCSNPFTKKRGALGYFVDPYKAHLAWVAAKQGYAKLFADMETDLRIKEAILSKFKAPN